MAALYAWPSELKDESFGLALTFVVPASSCNLRCSFCAITQRQEAVESRLTIADYVYFLRDIAHREPLSISSVQGYEPLLEEAWPYTSAILKTAREIGIVSSVVTNGTLLTERANALADLDPTGVAVSIDSAVAAQHDRARGVAGAFARTIEGVRTLAKIDGFDHRITVNSVLFPHRRDRLEGMPRLLERLGISHWSISPLLRIGGPHLGGPVGESGQIVEDLLALRDLASKHGVTVFLDDELRLLSSDFRDLVVRRFERPDGLIRLTPSGACSVGKDILKAVGPATPRWQPSLVEPHEFLRSILPPRC